LAAEGEDFDNLLGGRGRSGGGDGQRLVAAADPPRKDQPHDDEYRVHQREAARRKHDERRPDEDERRREHVPHADEERIDRLLGAELLLVRARQEQHIAHGVVQRIASPVGLTPSTTHYTIVPFWDHI